MSTMTMQERLAAIRHRIEQLNARAHAGAADAIRPHLDALHEQEKAVRAAVEKASDAAPDELEQLKTRVEIAEHSLAAGLAGARDEFTAEVAAELRGWDEYFEWLQTEAAAKGATARAQADAALADLRKRRTDVADRLGEARAASGESWREQKQKLGAAREELARKADELSVKLHEREG